MPVAASLVGAVALLAGTTALPTVLDGTSWVLPLVEVVLVVVLIGLGCRMIRTPPVVTVLAQLVAMAIALTSLFTASGIGGVLPSVSAYHEAQTLLSGAWEQIRTTVPPAPSTPELAFLIALSVGLAALIVDFLVAEAKAPALVALPLLCLYSVPAAIAGQMLPWYSFVAPAAAYLVLLAVAGHPGRRSDVRAGVGLAGRGVVIGALAVVVALALADAVTGVGTEGRLPRSDVQASTVGLSPFTTLHGTLLRGDPKDVLRVSGLKQPDYLRTVALTTWTPGQGWSLGDLRSDASDINGSLPGSQDTIDDATVTVTSYPAFRDRFLPLYGGTDAITGLGKAWDYDVALGTAHRTDPVNPGTYRLQVRTQRPTDAELEQDTVTPGGALTETGRLSPSVSKLAQDVTASASTAFDKALALQQYFTDPSNGFTYSLTVPTGDSGDALVDFLNNKQGYCEQYATAMAVMLRALGIPTRVGIGFTQGKQQPDGSYLIDSNDAHAWVEVAFDTNGWVRFDPTPLTNGQGGEQGFSPKAAGTASSSSAAPTEDTETSSTGRTANPDGERTRTAPSTQASAQGVADAADPGSSTGWRVVLWTLAVIVVVGALLGAPTWLRSARRRRRLELAAGHGPGAAAAAWAEIEDVATDHGILAQPTESARVVANRLARRAHLDDHGRGLLRAAVQAVETEWYGSADGSGQGPGGGSADGPDGAAAGLSGGAAGGPARGGRPAGGADATAAGAVDAGAKGVRRVAEGGTAVATRPAELVGAVRAVTEGLARQEPLRPLDRWFPRSLRRS
ncbi:transglutaminase family protein [Nakamurella endophytica]|uniref:transglutaminase family protein n=1 Tax=Nakamurella endophytica TaxID=1748367 RepID=UPI00166CC388|nr:DUF3488 and transglutaminase-like domain-containing protein [Nakamurella endophytica]